MNNENEQIEAQVRYYAKRQPVRMGVVDTPYVRRHFSEVATAAGLRDGERVCEWGAGMGRFSAQFARRGCDLTAIELSPALAEVCREALRPWPQTRVELGDIGEIAPRLQPTYDLVAAFFMLHHLPSVGKYFHLAKGLLKPGGRFVAVEPNPLNPLYAVQITCTPGMRWREEIGVYRMWPKTMRRAAEEAGLHDFSVYRYGALPRGPYNLMAHLGIERWPEYLTPPALRPFQVFTAWRPDA